MVTSVRSAETSTPGTRAMAWPVATSAILPGRSAACRSMRTVTPARAACWRSSAAEPSWSSAQISLASASIRTGVFPACGWPSGSTTTISSVPSARRSRRGSFGSPGGVSVTAAMSSSPLTTRSCSCPVRPGSRLHGSGPASSSRRRMAAGTTPAASDGVAPTASGRISGPSRASRAARMARSASLTAAWACGRNASPAGVGRTPRACRSSSGTPACRSSPATCRDTADCV